MVAISAHRTDSASGDHHRCAIPWNARGSVIRQPCDPSCRVARCAPSSFSDAPSLARHANNRAIWRSLRDLFPLPYAVTDALAFIARVREAEPETVVLKAMDRARENFGGKQDWARPLGNAPLRSSGRRVPAPREDPGARKERSRPLAGSVESANLTTRRRRVDPGRPQRNEAPWGGECEPTAPRWPAPPEPGEARGASFERQPRRTASRSAFTFSATWIYEGGGWQE
jgi:hypothetical protein